MNKPKKGYFVKGRFVAEGSDLDLEFKRELKGTDAKSRTEQKQESTALQALGQELVGLRTDARDALHLPETLSEALKEAQRITNFEGRRRQMQFIGKQMRQLPSATIDAIRTALHVQHAPSALETRSLHEAEQWRARLLQHDEALNEWIGVHPTTNIQQLRALVRQARKDALPSKAGAAVRHGRAYREIFQIIREHLAHPDAGYPHDQTVPISHPGADI